ncbi:MAG: glyoxalase/bleomycin resistance/extradiol dioxygenase family protein [Bacteroidales bacterium]|nr:glyoxalase/bleomycin resistance/extradiol dioxygenase family protein [Bacteroidales bacterium]
MHIEHIAIWTNDLERLKNFYIRSFNCRASELYTNVKTGFSSYFLSFGQGARIEIMKRNDIAQNQGPEKTGLAHFAISVGTPADVDDLTRKMQMDGIIIYSMPRITGDGYYESVVLDPDGNKVELVAETNNTPSVQNNRD